MDYTITLTQKELDIIRVSLDGSESYYDGALEASDDFPESEYLNDSLLAMQALIRRLAEIDRVRPA
ncbi:MAG: hypothetical protein HGB04_06615 [Chlorobiaceae bacterium]|nr:hypothetical protein [Chlorobiaceae bacterium]NTV02444.1 hypothetical protein [Chlorobiaceae bacterium]